MDILRHFIFLVVNCGRPCAEKDLSVAARVAGVVPRAVAVIGCAECFAPVVVCDWDMCARLLFMWSACPCVTSKR